MKRPAATCADPAESTRASTPPSGRKASQRTNRERGNLVQSRLRDASESLRSLKSSNPLWFASPKARPRPCSTLRQRPGNVLHSKTTIFASNWLPKHSPERPRWLPKSSGSLPVPRPETRTGPETSPARGSLTFPYFPFIKPPISLAAAWHLMPVTQRPPPPLYTLQDRCLRPLSLQHRPTRLARVGGFKRPATTCADPGK